MKRWILLLMALALIGASPAPALDTAPLLVPVNVWGDAFNAGQTAFPSVAFTDDCTVIDEFAPFAWSNGHENIRQWYAAVVGADSAQSRARFLASKQHVTFDAPRFVTERDGGAYLVFPSTLTYVSKGTAHTQRGTFAVVERRTDSGWRMVANSWAIDSDD
jgi:hypothetical protein